MRSPFPPLVGVQLKTAIPILFKCKAEWQIYKCDGKIYAIDKSKVNKLNLIIANNIVVDYFYYTANSNALAS